MTIGCNIWMICLILIWFFYGLSRMFQFPQLVWALRSSVWDVFINFLFIDATDRSKISGDQKRFFIALSLYPLSFFENTPFKWTFSYISTVFFVSLSSFCVELNLFIDKVTITKHNILINIKYYCEIFATSNK